MAVNITSLQNFINRIIQHQRKTDTKLSMLEDKLNESLFYINKVKNSITVKTGETEALTTLFTGQKIYVDTRDLSVAPSLLIDGFWEPEITHVFRKHINPDSVVFDVGANFGYFGIVAGTEVAGGKGSLHFFEANPDLINYIFKSLSVNGLGQKSQINNCAVSDKSGQEVELSVLEDLWGSSRLNVSADKVKVGGNQIKTLKKIKLKTVRLDDYVKDLKIKHVDVVKMDIEGHEDVAYRGMRKIIRTNPQLELFLEFTPAAYQAPKAFFEQIKKDFKYLYFINCDQLDPRETIEVKTYRDFTKVSNLTDWSMLLATNTAIPSSQP